MRSAWWNWIAAIGVSCVAVMAHAAPPKVTGVFPSGGGRGQTVTLTVSGEFSAWPVETWVDRPGVTLAAETDKGKLKATIAPDAAPGVYWFRLTNAEGASNLRPLVVGGAPEVEEVEPNDTPEKLQTLAQPSVVHGKLSKGGDVDSFALKLRQGTPLAAKLEANTPFGSPMDGVLQIVWISGPAYDAETPALAPTPTSGKRLEAFVLEQDDDAGGFDPRVQFVAPRDGWYAVRVFAFPTEPNSTIAFAGSDAYVYRLTISTTGIVEHPWPLAITAGAATTVRSEGWQLTGPALTERPLTPAAADPAQPNPLGVVPWWVDGIAGWAEAKVVAAPSVIAADASGPDAPQAISIPTVVSGRIEQPRDSDFFSFMGVKGKRVKVAVEARSLGFALDPHVAVTDAAGKQLAENDDAGKGRDSELVFAIPADGEYRIVVRDVHRHGGPRHTYRLTLIEPGRDFALTLAADTFALAADKPLEIPVTIERRDGFDQPIEFSVQGLPAGVAVAPVVSEPKGDSAKAIKLALTADAAAKFERPGTPIRIVGRIAGSPQEWRLATFATGAGPASAHHDAWLTLPAK